ncbi:MAG: hypothetical protein B6I20_11450 [Bacteroidetes bacterium 4572_117]|nr:MAG: hypothetical protein B6I20_11450 [Bacteroidetes bacterium 4572_117]
MQRYINQITSDIKAAQTNVLPDPELGTEKTYEEFEQKMLTIENAPDMPAKHLYGVSYEELPPPEKLTKQQMQQLIDAIIEMWVKFNISTEFPKNLPLKLRYELIRDCFEDDVHYMPGWSMHQDFCDGWCPGCKIADYCSSIDEIWTKEELEEERRKINK